MKTSSLLLSSLLFVAVAGCRPASPPIPEATSTTNTVTPPTTQPGTPTNAPSQIPTTGEPAKPNQQNSQ
ncbi:MAG: hypothetical protein JNN07_17040 [Verrucomicrobiales bacterium]|nr:hypothetical protein [Verrucomicrobiales bacterium]